MSIDVVDIFGANAGVHDRVQHYLMRAVTIVGRQCDMECIAAHAVAYQLGDDLRAAFLSEIEGFENQDTRALAHDKAVRQAAEFRDAAAQLTPDRLAELFAAERAAAPSVHGAGRRYFVDRSGKPPTERRKNRDEEHLGAALVAIAGDPGLELPDGAGRIRLLDYQVRAKIGPMSSPLTTKW